MVIVNKLAPDFSLPATDGEVIRLADLRGKNVVLYFYPKDCTQFVALNTVVLGVSRDTLRLHQKFKTEQQFPFELLCRYRTKSLS
ncbi:peroxiredoxin [Rickettsiella massiliensis]|uniref:peroxiredoxin n=1 Tax=Rickettsiella massiliensis TaxID=676517 RepID=UPI00029A5701|nr:redoxin domain-containing protein [Rickettsiella massiliensis]